MRDRDIELMGHGVFPEGNARFTCTVYQNAHLILEVQFKGLKLAQGSYHPEKHWQRFSSEVACMISLST